MKKLLFAFFLIPSIMMAQITEKYSDHSDGAKIFSEGGLTFNATSNLEVDIVAAWGYDDNNFISNFDSPVAGGGSVGSFTISSGNFNVHELYLIPLNSGKTIEQNNNILVRGKLVGSEQFTHTIPWNTINTSSSNNYFTYVDLNSYSAYTLDEIEFIIEPYGTNSVVYLMIDDFQFEADASLPVALSSFSASCEGRSIFLEWRTESETNNLGFILERSTGGNVWTTIASYKTDDALEGQGNTSSATDYMFMDSDVDGETAYSYRLSDVSLDSEINTYASLTIISEPMPKATEMEKAYPNPFNPKTYIAYHLAEDADVNIAVFDMLGRQLKTLYTGNQYAGSYHVYWTATNYLGRKVPTGTYFIRMQAGDIQRVQKVILIK
ncbi:T9SS type A sorting domain-containing protein [bacterium]|nr:T9SS type A sorting domain-containing protein [bacterium]